MVKLIAKITAVEGQEKTVAEALRQVAGPSQAEAGCLQYVPVQSKEDAARFYVLEEWESQEALDAHMETPHFKALIQQAGPYFACPPELDFVVTL